MVSENYSRLGCEAVQTGIKSTRFLRNILPPSSENTVLRNISKFLKNLYEDGNVEYICVLFSDTVFSSDYVFVLT